MKNLLNIIVLHVLLCSFSENLTAKIVNSPKLDESKKQLLGKALLRADSLMSVGMYTLNNSELSQLLNSCFKNPDEWGIYLHPVFTKLVASLGNEGQMQAVNKTLKKQFSWVKRYGGSALDLGKIFHNYGQICMLEKKYNRAINSLKVALIFKKNSKVFDLKTTIITYRELAFAYAKTFNYLLADKYYQTALALTKKIKEKDTYLESSIIEKYTSLLYTYEDFETIRSLLEYSNKLPYPTDYQKTEAILFGNNQLLDHVYIPTNDFSSARDCIKQSRALLDKHPEFKPFHSNFLALIDAITDYQEGKYKSALQKFQSVINPFDPKIKDVEINYAVENCVFMMYESAMSLGEFSLARQYLQKYKEIISADLLKDPFVQLENNLLDLELQSAENATQELGTRAISLLRKNQIDILKSVSLSDLINKSNLESIFRITNGILNNINRIQKDTVVAQNMLNLIKRRLEIRNLKQSVGLSGSINISQYKTEYRLIAQGLELCYYLNNEHPKNKTYATQALQLMERDKNNQLYLSIKRTSLTQNTNIPENIKKLEAKVQQQVRQYMAQNIAGIENKNENIVEIQQNYRQLMDDIIVNYPEYFLEKYKNDLFSDEILKNNKYLNGYSFVEYFTTDSTIYTIVKGTKSPIEFKSVHLDKPEKFDQLLKQFSLLFTIKPGNAKENEIDRFINLNNELRSIIWEPICENISKNVLIVCDNRLSSIPFDVLLSKNVTSANNWKDLPYLIEKYNFNYIPSLQFLNLKAPTPSHNKKKFLGLSYSPPQPNKMNILPLNFAGKEVDDLSRLIDGDILTQQQCTEKNIQQKASEYMILHLACHGKADSLNGNESFLVLSEENSNSPRIVYAHNFYSSSLNNDLVVLSACESALGQAFTGEGIIGLTRAFFYSGARSVLSTLWQVSDYQAGEILGNFYKNLLNQQDKASALANAKRTYIKNATTTYSHPFYWASYIISGDPDELSFSAGTSARIMVFGTIIGLFLTYLFYKRFK